MIGSAPYVSDTSYAIITSMKWVVGDPGYAEATLRYIDGSEDTVTVNSIAGHDGDTTASFGADTDEAWSTFEPEYVTQNVGLSGNDAKVSNDTKYNGMYRGYALYKVEVAEDGAVDLTATNFLHKNDSVVKAGSTVLNSNGGVGDRVYLDDATVFVARQGNAVTGYTYVEYVGKDNVPTYVDNTASVFYITGSDNVADFVYIQSGTLDGSGYALVAAMDDQYSEDLFEGENLWVLASAQVNGVDVVNGVASETASYITSMADSERQLYYVEYDANGLVMSAKAVTSSDITLKDTDNTVHMLKEPTYTDGKGTLIDGADSWNVTNVPVYGDYTDLADVDFDEVYAYIVENNKDQALAVYVYDIPEGAVNPDDLTITNVTVMASQGVNINTPVDAVTFSAQVAKVSTGQFNGTITATPVWEKVNPSTGVWETFNGDVFVAGTYRAKITLNVSNTDYVLTDSTVINYYNQANKTGTFFYTDQIVIP